MTTAPPTPIPRAGQAWTVGGTLLSLLADTPVTVTGVRGGLVHFTTASGMTLRFPVQVFRLLFDRLPS